MSDTKKSPTHYRLLSTLRAIGPYLRESQCVDGSYLFDCLSVCVNDKKSPEKGSSGDGGLSLNSKEMAIKRVTEPVYTTQQVNGWMKSCHRKW